MEWRDVESEELGAGDEGWVLPSGEVRPGVRSPEVWRVQLEKAKHTGEGGGRE